MCTFGVIILTATAFDYITTWRKKRRCSDIEESPTEQGVLDDVTVIVNGECIAVRGATAEVAATTTEVTRDGLTKLTSGAESDGTVADNKAYFTLAKEEGSGHREEGFGLLSCEIVNLVVCPASRVRVINAQLVPKVNVFHFVIGKPMRALLAFSLRRNVPRLLSTSMPPGAYMAFNGIRFMSMTWIILGHTWQLGLYMTQHDRRVPITAAGTILLPHAQNVWWVSLFDCSL